MTDPAFPSAGGPPPLPVLPPLPLPLPPQAAIPLPPMGGHLPALPPGFAPAPAAQAAYTAAYPPPPLPASGFPGAFPPAPPAPPSDGPVFHEPPDLETEPLRAGGPGWVLWAVPAVVLVMIAGGVLAFVATRGGPTPATANAPTFVPTPPPRPAPAPQGTIKVAPRRMNSNRPNPTLGELERKKPLPEGKAPAGDQPGTKLPSARNFDGVLKDLWKVGESSGLQFKTIRTMKMQRNGNALVQPVELKFNATFPQAVSFLQRIREDFPAAVPASFDAAPATTDPAGGAAPLPVSLLVTWHLVDDGGENLGGTIACPDISRSLIDVARAAEGKVGLVGVAIAVDGAGGAPGTMLRPKVKVTGLAESDVNVAAFIHKLSADGHVRDVNLVVSESAQAGERQVRKFTVELVVPQAAGNSGRSAASAMHMPDPFQPLPFLRAAQNHGEPGAPQGPTFHAPAETADAQREARRLVKSLNLQTIVTRDGTKRVCMINNKLLRVGQQVEGFTIEDITADTVTVRRAESVFQLKLKR